MDYFEELKQGLDRCYAIATKARMKGFDPEKRVEIKLTSDVASRVEGIVGPPGIEKVIREMEKGGMKREDIAFKIAERIAVGEVFKGTLDERIEQAVRTGVGILTEGVLVAPTEGIAKVRDRENPDGTNYVSVYYSGPIRSAGGTAAALSVMLADIARRAVGVGDYRPTDTEIERYVEEVNIYEARITHLQYKPKDEDVRTIVKNCPVCVDGEPTEQMEVSVHKNLERVETNRVRGGVPLVICEGIALKATKLLKYTKQHNLGWNWLEKIIKIKVKEDKVEIKPDDGYLDGLVAGRPVFSGPSKKGGFRLRYGKTRTNGIMGKSVHPATMIILDDFLAYGTQMKLEKPGKGCVVSTCESIEPPVVRLKNGDLIKVHTIETAKKINEDVEKILFLGDLVVALGDFVKSNHPLLTPGYCEEWWDREVEEKSLRVNEFENSEDAFDFSKKHQIPLHPKYTFFWDSIDLKELEDLVKYLERGIIHWNGEEISEFKLDNNEEKNILEELLIEHRIRDGKIIVEKDNAYTLLNSLGMLNGNDINSEKIIKLINEKKTENCLFSILKNASGVEIRAKGGTYIGARMGRPEKAKERAMDGKPNILFPTGDLRNRSLLKKYERAKETEKRKMVNLELARFKCRDCSNISIYPKCGFCGAGTQIQNICSKCNAAVTTKEHCGSKIKHYERRPIDIVKLFDDARKVNGGFLPEDLKGIKTLNNRERIPERLEKGLLRAKYGVYVFRDGTSRFDATDVALTHFKPNEIGLSLEKAKEIGYYKDYLGKDLVDGEQLVPLKVQDIILAEAGATYFLKITKFLDDLLVNLYRLPAHYNAEKKEDLIGKFTVGLSPHTSAGVLCRIIGFTKAHVGYAHPYFHTAKRRNCDADEDSLMLLLDSLLNFSKHYLSERRGGTMDTAIVLNMKLNPKEVDDEVFCMEIVDNYPLDFYKACEKNLPPYKVKIKKIEDILGTPEQYGNLPFTLHSETINEGNIRTSYVSLGSIPDKLDAEFKLEEKLKCVDEKDVAHRLILSHFIPDLYGNLRSYSRQTFRCVDCNTIFRRVPLSGKCRRCNGKLTLTIHRGGIVKYLEIAKNLCKRYGLSLYLKQRLELVQREVENVFKDEKKKQTGLAEFL